MKFKSLAFLASFLLITLAGCTDAERASFGAYGEEAKVTCYSGGQVIFQEQSTGKISNMSGEGIVFKNKATNEYVRAFADCIVISK